MLDANILSELALNPRASLLGISRKLNQTLLVSVSSRPRSCVLAVPGKVPRRSARKGMPSREAYRRLLRNQHQMPETATSGLDLKLRANSSVRAHCRLQPAHPGRGGAGDSQHP